MQGISGVDVVQITATAKPLLKAATDAERPIIRSKPDQMASLLEGGGRALQQATELLDRANRLLSDRNIAALDAAMRGDAAAAIALTDRHAGGSADRVLQIRMDRFEARCDAGAKPRR